MVKLNIETLMEDLKVEFEVADESDYHFFQHLIKYLVRRLENTTVVNNLVVFYGAYTMWISGRKIKFHFTNGKFTHITSDRRNMTQTYNKESFE